MKYKDGVAYLTIADVAARLSISVSTVRRYIRNGTFPKPRREYFGRQSIAVFTEEDIHRLKKRLDEIRDDTRRA